MIVREVDVRAYKERQHNLQIVVGKQSECRAVEAHVLKEGGDGAAGEICLFLSDPALRRARPTASAAACTLRECIEPGQLVFKPRLRRYCLLGCHLRRHDVKRLGKSLARSGILQHVRGSIKIDAVGKITPQTTD